MFIATHTTSCSGYLIQVDKQYKLLVKQT